MAGNSISAETSLPADCSASATRTKHNANIKPATQIELWAQRTKGAEVVLGALMDPRMLEISDELYRPAVTDRGVVSKKRRIPHEQRLIREPDGAVFEVEQISVSNLRMEEPFLDGVILRFPVNACQQFCDLVNSQPIAPGCGLVFPANRTENCRGPEDARALTRRQVHTIDLWKLIFEARVNSAARQLGIVSVVEESQVAPIRVPDLQRAGAGRSEGDEMPVS